MGKNIPTTPPPATRTGAADVANDVPSGTVKSKQQPIEELPKPKSADAIREAVPAAQQPATIQSSGGPKGGLVIVVEESSDRLGRWFARYGDDLAETFSARLLNGTDELSIGWTDDVTQFAENIAEIQGEIGRNRPVQILSARFKTEFLTENMTTAGERSPLNR